MVGLQGSKLVPSNWTCLILDDGCAAAEQRIMDGTTEEFGAQEEVQPSRIAACVKAVEVCGAGRMA